MGDLSCNILSFDLSSKGKFQKLGLKLSVFLFLSHFPRFNFGFNDTFRTYNQLVWKFGSLFESYLDFIWGEFKFELKFKFEST
jgi:hypothetical protein